MNSDLNIRKFAHQTNIDRYRKILATCLTAEERSFVERRISEEQSALQQRKMCASEWLRLVFALLEGASEDAGIESHRLRQIKNFFVTLLVSRGVPMLLGGDEFRRTQHGNNNAYCHDNETSWYDWQLAQHNVGLQRFVSRLIALRKMHPVMSAESFYTVPTSAGSGSTAAHRSGTAARTRSVA